MDELTVLTITVQQLLEKEIELGIPSLAVDFERSSIEPPDLTQMRVTIVAKRGGRGDDWAAYTGLPKGTFAYLDHLMAGIDLSRPERIATNGDKISRILAEALFPEFVEAGMIYRL